jgi:hypothetical protein
MDNYFLNGFVDELTKEAAHPLFTSMNRGGTLLGQRVRGLMKRVVKRSRKIGKGGAKKSVEGAKKLKRKSLASATAFKKTSMNMETLPGVKAPKQRPSYGTGAGALVRATVREAGKARGQRTAYGTGGGNLGARKAPAFTSNTRGGKLGNPTENPDRFGTGCGTKTRR